MNQSNHAVVIPLYGDLPNDWSSWTTSLVEEGFIVVLVENNSELQADGLDSRIHSSQLKEHSGLHILYNKNKGGVAGGFNRGVHYAIGMGIQWVTLLDQDSRLSPVLIRRLTEPWRDGAKRLLVGPMIWDGRRAEHHGRRLMKSWKQFRITRLLISSGTTFATADWSLLGPMFEWLVVDYVDHSWCFRARERGFQLLQHPEVSLVQHFGNSHPNPFCHWLGMELYSPRRHFYQLRNLRWLLLNPLVPLDLRFKEFIKMLVKPWLWLLCEPQKCQNLRAVFSALLAHLPPSAAWK